MTAKTSKAPLSPSDQFLDTQRSQGYTQNGIHYSTKSPVILVAPDPMGVGLFANLPAQRLPNTKNKKLTWSYLKSRS